MKKLLRNYPQAVLAALAIAFMAIVVAAYAWGVGDVVAEMHNAVSSASVSSQNVGFNLGAAAHIDLRGLVK